MSVEKMRDLEVPAVGSVIMTETLIRQMSREVSDLRFTVGAATMWMGVILVAGVVVATIDTALMGAWVAFTALACVVIVLGLATQATRRARRAHLAAIHPPGTRVTVAVSDDQVELETPAVYCAYSRESLSPVQVRDHGVYMLFGSSVVAIPRAALLEDDVARLLAVRGSACAPIEAEGNHK